MAANPLVSVCIPTYRYGHWLGRCLDSVLGQTLADYEVIVVDDASQDNTPMVISHYADPRLRFVQNETRLGMVANWNKALQLGQGRYLAMLHGDDFYYPSFLEKAAATLEAEPSAGFVFSAYRAVDDQGKLLQTIHPWQSAGLIPGAEAFRRMLRFNPVRCPTVLVRREVYDKLGWFDPNLIFVTDWEMWLRILRHYDVVYLDEPLAAYRLHSSSTTNQIARRAGAFSADEQRMLEKLFANSHALKSERDLQRQAWGYAARRGFSRRLRLLNNGEGTLFLTETKLALRQPTPLFWKLATLFSLPLTFLPPKARLRLLARFLTPE